ncbi:hypothetical protein PCC7424_3233 [Gloeothece citriformis PCC 7424]|uniref:Uncharacterized protein n=1 Tax=Gloeothece citriformis (strain PCC 7424) TaxID=65393 RepID=B7KCT2_GLOC7|nr:hypothetical protein PCC7424_3233 [Gloeothece citriformis PCC 7424]
MRSEDASPIYWVSPDFLDICPQMHADKRGWMVIFNISLQMK